MNLRQARAPCRGHDFVDDRGSPGEGAWAHNHRGFRRKHEACGDGSGSGAGGVAICVRAEEAGCAGTGIGCQLSAFSSSRSSPESRVASPECGNTAVSFRLSAFAGLALLALVSEFARVRPPDGAVRPRRWWTGDERELHESKHTYIGMRVACLCGGVSRRVVATSLFQRSAEVFPQRLKPPE